MSRILEKEYQKRVENKKRRRVLRLEKARGLKRGTFYRRINRNRRKHRRKMTSSNWIKSFNEIFKR